MSSAIVSQVNGTVLSGPVKTTGDAILVPILFAIIFLIGVVGNVTLIFTVLKKKSLRNTPNIFVVSLSIGDLLLLLCSVRFSSTLFTCFSWPFGIFLCKFNEFMQTLSLGVSVFTLTALSGDRYIAIVHPMSKHTGKPKLKTVVAMLEYGSVPQHLPYRRHLHQTFSILKEEPLWTMATPQSYQLLSQFVTYIRRTDCQCGTIRHTPCTDS
ncbi:CCH1R-like protein [Mya arenaria]|uniref:CCH1R-like protein n=1 Tax=Mya arenaria TaxID=6604 RepID=A0ABY7EJF2_MYAAR|nr:CCH1R-like protein [Mya arenaria]